MQGYEKGKKRGLCCKFARKNVEFFAENVYTIFVTYMKKYFQNGRINMPNIKPVSDLRNYTAVINEVAYGNRVYLTRNGHGQCAIVDMKELDELDKQKALCQLMRKLNEAEISIREEGTITAEKLEEKLD